MRSSPNHLLRQPNEARNRDQTVPPLTFKDIKGDVIRVALIVGVACLHRFATDAVFVGLAIWAVTSPLNAFRALLLAVPLIYKNPFLGMNGMELAVLRWVLVLGAGWRLLSGILRQGGGIYSIAPLRHLHVFCGVAFLTTLIANPTGVPGFFKLAIFAFGATAITAGASLVRSQSRQLLSWLIAIGLVYIAGSALLARTGIGYYDRYAALGLRSGPLSYAETEGVGGLMGMLSHSQSFGVYMALVAFFFYATAVATIHRSLRWLLLGGTVACLGLVMLSQTRTAGLALALTVVTISGYIFLILRGKVRCNFSLPQLAGIGLLLVLAYAGLSMALGRNPGGMIRDYIAKSENGAADLSDAYASSRGGLIRLSLASWRKSPVIGIGFGRNSWEALGYAQEDDTDEKGLLRYFSNPNEKGVIWSAVLEETGVVGLACFALFLCSLAIWIHRQGNPLAMGMLLVVLLCNLGEMNFFSMGGLGLLQWTCLGTALALGDHCKNVRPVFGYTKLWNLAAAPQVGAP